MSTVVFQDENLPAGWLVRTLGEFVAQRSVGILPPKTPDEIFELYSVPSHETGSPEIVAGREIGSNKQVVEEGTVLLCKINPRINRTWVVSSFSQHQKIASTEWITFPRTDAFEPKFLAYYLRQDALRDFLAANASGVGGSLMRVKPSTVSDYPVPLAPRNEQARIVAEIEKQFSRLDEAVANLKRVKANLKRYKAAVLKAAVEGKLTEEWRRQHPDVEPADKLLERILAERRKAAGKGKYKEPVAPDTSGLPELPAGWVVASLEQITSASRVICYGILMPKENIPDGIPYVKVKDMKGDKIDILGLHRTTPEIAEEYKRASLKVGDILLSIRGTYGRVAEVPPELEGGNITQDTARLVVLPHVDRNFIAIQLRAPDMQLYFKRVARGVAVKGVNIGEVRLAPIFLPPLAEQHQIVAEVERRLSIVAEAEAEVDNNLRRADRLRQSILKQAFSGQLIPQDPNDEPVGVLLERIRENANVGARLAAPITKPANQKRARQASPLRKPEPVPAAYNDFPSLDAVLTAILDRMQPGQEYSRADLADPLGLSTGRWNTAIQELKRRGQVRQVGEKRGARYSLISAIKEYSK